MWAEVIALLMINSFIHFKNVTIPFELTQSETCQFFLAALFSNCKLSSFLHLGSGSSALFSEDPSVASCASHGSSPGSATSQPLAESWEALRSKLPRLCKSLVTLQCLINHGSNRCLVLLQEAMNSKMMLSLLSPFHCPKLRLLFPSLPPHLPLGAGALGNIPFPAGCWCGLG